MINYQEEIKHFKPSLDVDNIEDVISGMTLTDMNDLMMQLVQNAADANKTASQETAQSSAADEATGYDNSVNES